MAMPTTGLKPDPMPKAIRVQRLLLGICILLTPLSISLYLVSWSENLRYPLVATAAASPVDNTLHLIGGLAASFFLPLGYLGMSLLGMRCAPGLATLAAALSLIGWTPWSALISLDDLAYDITQTSANSQMVTLWTNFNSDPVMTTYLLIYIIGHLLSGVLIGFMLGRLRLIPTWAARALALTSPLTMLYFPIPTLLAKNVIKYLICILSSIGIVPAAIAMFHNKGLAGSWKTLHHHPPWVPIDLAADPYIAKPADIAIGLTVCVSGGGAGWENA